MKKISLILLLVPGFCFGQVDLSDGSIFWDTAVMIGTTSPVFESLHPPFLSGRECELWEKFTDWKAESKSETICGHVWVYAEWQDVNTALPYTTAQYCPCGCDKQENEARICEACSRHERRTRFFGWETVERKSTYLKLLKKAKQ